METFNIVLGWDKPKCGSPEELTKEKTCDLVGLANDFSFEIIKKHYVDQVLKDPMIMPLLISAIGHDWVYKHHKWNESQFKAALFHHKVIEDPSIAQKLEQKQFELMMYIQQKNPMMMGGMGMPGMPGMQGGGGMGGL